MQTGCFLRSSPKAGLNAVLVRRKTNCQTLSICMPMNDLLLLLFGCATVVVYVAEVPKSDRMFVILLIYCALLIDIVVCRLLL